ncbi:MAG: HAD-IA family hydrolase [Candidatus Dormibacteraeota bacterium]|nr:HAD-IA family hydrolase [Candidatus Dormibacteraeota bacterium]
MESPREVGGVPGGAGERACALFDLDGVLLDSVPAYTRAWHAWCLEWGVEEAAVWALAHGRRPRDVISMVGPGLEAGRALQALETLIAAEYKAVEAFPGAADLLGRLWPGSWAIVTSGGRRLVAPAFRRLGLPLPTVLVSGDDVVAGKPDPTCYLIAAERLGARAEACIVVEDAPAGIRAAAAAGMATLAVATTHAPEELGEAGEVHPSLAAAGRRLLQRMG